MNHSAHSILVAATLSLVAATSQADIGFPAAVTACRAAVPTSTLLEVELRERDGIIVYEGGMYTSSLTNELEPRIHPMTGALIEIDSDSIPSSELSNLQQIFAMLPTATLDFADAITIASGSASGSGLQKIEIDIEEGILAFQLEYFDSSKIYVDAVTGGIIPHHNGNDDFEETLSSTSFNGCVNAAITSVGEGWVAFEGETEDESSSSSSGMRVEVRFFNVKSASAMQVTVALSGAILSTNSYSPSSTQASRIAQIRALLDTLNVPMASAVDTAVALHVGAGVHEAELKVEQGGLVWKVELVTPLFVEIDVFVDASVVQFLYSTAPVNPVFGDFNEDGLVDGTDLTELFSMWGLVNPTLDFDGDGSIGAGDLTAVLSSWQ